MKEKKNYIDNIPRINDMKWEVLEDGIVEIIVETIIEIILAVIVEIVLAIIST